MLEFITRIRKRWVDPKVYAVFITSQPCGCWRLWHGVEYSLDEATAAAFKTFGASCPHGVPLRPVGSAMLTIEQIEKGMTTNEIRVENAGGDMAPLDAKNALMRAIIATKDIKLFEESRTKFTPAEVSLIEDSLNRK